MMDKDTIETDAELISTNNNKSFEAKAMEESLANMITLQCFEKYDKENFEIVKDFVEHQSAIYQFGIQQFYANADWKRWRESQKQSTPALCNWFTACFDNGEIREGLMYSYDNEGFHISVDLKWDEMLS